MLCAAVAEFAIAGEAAFEQAEQHGRWEKAGEGEGIWCGLRNVRNG